MNALDYAHTGSLVLPGSLGSAPQGVELRHLRYFVAVADAGTFTHAAERMYVAQPTLSQQIKRLEEMVGAQLLRRRREGVRLTEAGMVLLEESRAVLSLIDHGVRRTRQAAGVGRPRLRFVVPPHLPETLAVETASRLRSAAAQADVEVAWIEQPLDAEFSPIRERRADAGLGWMDPVAEAFPDPLEVMNLGEFEPHVWIPSTHPAAARETISLDELARLDVVHGPRRAGAEIYDAWLTILRTANAGFEFTDPPFRRSFHLTMAFATTGSRPTAVLTGPQCPLKAGSRPDGCHLATDTYGMVPVRVEAHPLTATAGLVWNGDLPRQLQQVLVDAVQDALDRNALVGDDSDVSVDTSGSTVILRGHVRTWADATRWSAPPGWPGASPRSTTNSKSDDQLNRGR